MVVVPEARLEGAAVLTERIRKAIKNNKFDKVGKVTASFGITEFKKDDDIDSFIKRADDALYMAKSSGRDRVEIGSTLSSSSRQFAIPLK
jgi:diguanylate cyclase (GGDEF)-like protein